jgi:hypothetical protein
MRSTDLLNWSELQSEHFQLRTDLTPEDARQAIADLELLRAALLAAGWHSSLAGQGRTLVVELASGAELREFAHKGIEGFVATDAFHQPIMVVSADRDLDDQQVLEHELAHVITNAFLVRNPRWVAEGTACYLETLKLDRKRKKLFVGGVNADRIVFLQRYPVLDYSTLMQNRPGGRKDDSRSSIRFRDGGVAAGALARRHAGEAVRRAGSIAPRCMRCAPICCGSRPDMMRLRSARK